MKILKVNYYRDGGTLEIITDIAIFCIDGRIRSSTKGHLYTGYPEFDNSNINNNVELKKDIIELLKEYKQEDLQVTIDHFVKSQP